MSFNSPMDDGGVVIDTKVYYWTVKKKTEISKFVSQWMELENITLSNQTQKDKHFMSLFI